VVLLRGVNVGGKNRLPMSGLQALLEEAGCGRVQTFIQSGNAVCSATPRLAAALPAELTRRLLQRFGLTVPVVVRTAREFRSAVAGNPFLADGVDPDQLHLSFLADHPSAARAAELDPGRSPPDAFALRGRELYLWLPGGVARTRLTSDYLDRTLGTVGTVRNWRTVSALLALVEG
jgi:uncharacterized protein (DUF1697 family)